MASHAGRLTLAPESTDAPDTGPDTAASEPVVRVHGLTRGFDGRAVLRGVDLEIDQGEFVALLGRSGSGKSTMLRAVAGLDHGVPGTGDVTIPDNVSMVFQDSRLLPWQRLLANVTFALPGSDARERGRAALAEVGLGGRERAWPHELSGGEQQRAALARSLVREPRLLLADEPFGALDALTRIRMQALLLRLVEVHRPAVLLVTHSVDEAITLADRVVVLTDGVISTDLRIDLGFPRDITDPRFAELRSRLLSDLGVVQGKEVARSIAVAQDQEE